MQTISNTCRGTNLLLARDEALLVRSVIHEVALGSLGHAQFQRTIGFGYDAAVGLRERIDAGLGQDTNSDVAMALSADEVALIARCVSWALDDFAGDEFQTRVGFSRELAEEQRAAWVRLTGA